MAYLEDHEHGDICPKAAWRRQNTARIRVANASTPKNRNHISRQKGHNARKSKVEAPCRKTGRSTDGKAHWPVQLTDWFRSTLNEQGDFALSPDIWVSSPFSHELSPCASPCARYESELSCDFLQSEMSLLPPAEAVFSELFRRSSAPEADYIYRRTDSIIEFPELEAAITQAPSNVQPIVGDVCETTPELDGVQRLPGKVKAAMVDASTQCCVEDEEMGMSRMKQGLFGKNVDKTWESLYAVGVPYSVETHFSLYEEPVKIARYADQLGEEELKDLADRFFGRWIAGIKITRSMKPCPRRVPEKHAMEASLIAATSPAFRRSLLISAKRSLLGGRDDGLLQRAHECPTTWAKLAYTALDWSGQLVRSGALPKAFAAECLRGLAELAWRSSQGSRAFVLGLCLLIPAVRLSSGMPGSCRLPRAVTDPGVPVRQFSPQLHAVTDPSVPLQRQLIRSMSAPASYRRGGLRRERDFTERGTNLGTKAPHQFHIYPSISMYGATSNDRGGSGATCEVGAPISPDDLPEYWRYAAGGEHALSYLERQSREAEESLGYSFSYCECCLIEHRHPEPSNGMCCGKAVQNERLPLGLAICPWKRMSLKLLLARFHEARVLEKTWDDFVWGCQEFELD